MRSRDDIEDEIAVLYKIAEVIITLEILLGVHADLLDDLFSAKAMSECDCENGVDMVTAMKHIAQERLREVKKL